MPNELDDFRLRFESAGSDWQVVVENVSAGTTAREPLRWPVLPEPLARAWTVRTTRREPAASGELAALEEIGDALFQAVFAGATGECLRSGLDDARQRRRGLRIWVHPGGQPVLDSLPWEVLFDRRGDRFLSQSESTPVIRCLETAEPLRRRPPRRPLRILLPMARPPNRQRLNVESELQAIEEALAARQAGDVVLEPLAGATLDRLRRRLDDRRRPCHVVHFIGHAGLDAAIQAGVLVFERDGGGSRAVGARHLGPLLLDHDALQLLVLNACEGCRVPVQGTSPGLAQALMRQRIPAVVAMQTPITDRAGIAFAGHFYSALAAGCAVDVAVARCRKAMFPDGREEDWTAPVLYLRSAQAPLLPLRARPGDGAAAPRPTGAAASPAQDARHGPGAGPPAPLPAPRVPQSLTIQAVWRRIGLVAAALLAGVGCLWLGFGERWRPRRAAADAVVPAGAAASALQPAEVPECPPAPELAMKLMRLGPGRFLMGSPHGGAADERPAHYVTLGPFCMGAYEVTRAQWREVMGEAAGRRPRDGDDLPVEDVSWDDVQVFLARLNGRASRGRYRLPTEAEWEYAARAGSGGAYSFGDDPGERLYRFGNCKSLEHDDGFDRLAPVGSFLPNRWGLHDLYGNVSEWVEDAYDRYGAAPATNPHVLDGPLRVRRGGSWAIIPKNCRSASRNKSRPDSRRDDIGFRLVRIVGE